MSQETEEQSETRQTEVQQQSGAIKVGQSAVDVLNHLNGVDDKRRSNRPTREEAQQPAEISKIDHATAPLKGLGLWIWVVDKCEGGQPARIAKRAVDSGLSHVVIKIADGSNPLRATEDRVVRTVEALTASGVQVWGWHYVKGNEPIEEARLAATKSKDLKLNGYIAYLESEFKQPGKEAAWKDFIARLKQLTHSLPVGLSSFHYPSLNREMPWQTLLESVDFVVPQVYWEQTHNPGSQLTNSLTEYTRLTPARPFFPLGSAFQSGDWKPTPSDLAEFIQTARDLGLNGMSLFSWDWIGLEENRDLWAVLDRMRWETVGPSGTAAGPVAERENIPPATPVQLESPMPAPTFERRFIQIIRNDEVERVEDRLGFDKYAEAFVQLVLDDRTRPPLTVGISGAWGSGKSFLLHRIYTKLHALPLEKHVRVVTFNAWDYNAADVVWPGLVRGILDKLEETAGSAQRTLSRVRRNLQRQVGSVRSKFIPWAALLIAALAIVAYLTRDNLPLLVTSLGALGLGGAYALFKSIVDLPMAQWLTDLFQESRGYGSAVGYMDEIRADIKELKKRLPVGTKIVVIIDDLDRCDADKIVNTLEALKLLLNFDIFIVFLAVDSSVIARAVEKRYKDMLAEAGRSGYFYLDKIIQIPFRLPDPDPAMVNKYLFGLLSAADAPAEHTLPAQKARRLGELLMPAGANGLSEIHKMIARLPDDPARPESIAGEILAILKQNGFLKPDGKTFAGEARQAQAALAWALLARWGPVTAYFMHETMRALPADIHEPGKSPASGLSWLAEQVKQKAEADIRTQRLREVVEGQLGNMMEKVIDGAPGLSLDELEAMLSGWKTPYAITIGFTPAELEAFQNLSTYLYKNPRHIKRLVNTYSLIRMLASRSPDGELVLNAPETMLKWLIISSQWPFTSQAMLQAFDDERDAMRAGELLAEDDDVLTRLYQKSTARIDLSPDLQKERARLDGDPDVLGKFIGDSLRTLTSRQLNLLRAYSINFNPAENSLPPSIIVSALAQPAGNNGPKRTTPAPPVPAAPEAAVSNGPKKKK